MFLSHRKPPSLDLGPARAGRVVLFLFLFLFLFTSGLATARPRLSKSNTDKITRGEVIRFSQKVPFTGVMLGKAIGMIEDTPEAVVHVLLAMDKFKHFLPRLTEARIVKTKGSSVYAMLHANLPWPIRDCWVYTKATRRAKHGRVFELNWKTLNGTIKHFHASALIEPWNKDASKSVLTFKVLFEPETSTPDALLTRGIRHASETLIHRTRLRLRALRKYGKMPSSL